MAGSFKVGDTVRLKSGRPLMTVEAIGVSSTPDMLACIWFGNVTKQRGVFPAATLDADKGDDEPGFAQARPRERVPLRGRAEPGY